MSQHQRFGQLILSLSGEAAQRVPSRGHLLVIKNCCGTSREKLSRLTGEVFTQTETRGSQRKELTKSIDVSRCLHKRHKAGDMDLEAVELALRASSRQARATAFIAMS